MKKENVQIKARCSALEAKLKEVEESHQINEENYKKELLAVNDKYHQLEAENEKLRGDTKNKTSETSLELAQAREQILTLKRENEKLISTHQQALEQNDSKAKALARENQDLIQKLTQLQKDASKLRDERAGFEGKITELEQVLKASQAAEENYKKELFALNEKCRLLESENEKPKAETRNANTETFLELNKHIEQLLALRKENEQQLLILQRSIEEKDMKIKFLEKENHDFTQRLTQLEEDISAESKDSDDRAEWISKASKFEQLLKRSQETEENYKKELFALNDKLPQLQAENENLKAKNDRLRAENEKLQGEQKNKQTETSMELAQYKEQVLALKKENEKQLLVHQHLIEENDSKIKALVSENRELTQRLTQLQKDLSVESKSKEDRARLVEKVAELEQELKITQSAHNMVTESLQEEIKKLKLDLQAAKEQAVNRSDDEIASIEFENDKLKRQIKELNNKIANSKLDNDFILTKENQQLKSKLESIQKTNQHYEEEIQNLNVNSFLLTII